MTDRLRALFESPLEPAVARAVVVLALAVGLGAVIVVALAGVDRAPVAGRPTTTPIIGRSAPSTRGRDEAPAAMPRQDPQDLPGTAAHRRAAAELAEHRALQHIPFERGGVSIELVGARQGRAVIRIRAATTTASRRAWKAFLARSRDPGDAYAPIFVANRTRRES
jgi:hypothetical protein